MECPIFLLKLDPNEPSTETPSVENTCLTALEVCPIFGDVDRDWDIREIIGKDDIDGVTYHLVDSE